MTMKKSAASAQKGAMTRADYDRRVEAIAVVAGSRFGRGNVALKAGLMLTSSKFEHQRASVLTKAGVKFNKN
jgi:hypothetical protein